MGKKTNRTSESRLPWHKPEVQKLTVNLDTSGQVTGSQTVDFATG